MMPTSPYPTSEARWAAVQQRDAAADAWFRYAVLSTGVYCRPSCPSRPARRENVRFHASAEAAEAAGFRACKRCHPRDTASEPRLSALAVRVARLIEGAERPPTLAELAAAVHLSPFHLQRRFKQATGVSPREYAEALRRRRVAHDLGTARTVTDAGYAAGYGSTARLYADAPATLGMTPGEYARGAAGLPIRAAVARCSLGQVLVATTERGVCAILLGDEAEALRADLARRFPQAAISAADRGLGTLLKRVVSLVEHPAQDAALTLDVRGTVFQQRVWQALRQVACGETVSYAELARRIGLPRAARAVAAACAANAIAVAIPCHRVVRGDGSLSGYRWGTERKRALLAREAGDGPVRKRRS